MSGFSKIISIPKNLNNKLGTKKNKMTLIIGMRFKDGVLLVSDRKVTEEGTGRATYQNKLNSPLVEIPLVFGAAGYSHKFKQFNRKIIDVVNQRLREIQIDNMAYLKERGYEYSQENKKDVKKRKLSSRDIETAEEPIENEDERDIPNPYIYTHEMFIDDCGNLIRGLCTGKDGLLRPDLDVLLIRFATEPTLHHINLLGEEEELDYCAIGSGNEYVGKFLREFWEENMSIEEALKLAYFCIYYVQDLKFDLGVGVEEGKLPDHQVIIHDGTTGVYNGFDDKIQKVISEVKKEVEKFQKAIDSLPFKKNGATSY